jgi:uncharacterized protein GlcG (DUF336 family)
MRETCPGVTRLPSRPGLILKIVIALAASVAWAGSSRAQETTFVTRQLTPETALKLARASLEACRKEGFQVAVAVSDRAGIPQVVLRDRYAGPHTVDVAVNKAWTAITIRQDTLSFARATAELTHAGPRHFARIVAVGGGVPVESAGSMLAAVAVSGGSAEADDRCARAGIVAIREDLDF